LDVLETAGLIKSEKKGQYVHYSLVRENLVTCMYNFIADFCSVSGPLKRESKKLAAKKGK
jgi:ArsR family transcriptional regulator, arsenate/arsenite/antimonite-responsive transcriptional repressor